MPANEAAFTISVTGASGEQYRGDFKMKVRLSHRDTARMDAYRREILGPSPEGQAPSKDALNTAAVFAKIWTHLLSAPSWWTAKGNGLDLEDEEPVVAVLKEIQARENEVFAALKKEAVAAEEALRAEVKKP